MAERRAVEVEGLEKRYPKAPSNAVDGVSFTVAAGRGVRPARAQRRRARRPRSACSRRACALTAGVARVVGIDVTTRPRRARSMLAVVPQRNNLDRSLSIRQNLIFHAAYHRVPAAERNRRADELLELFGLADRADDKVDFVSGGQAQRIMIARAMMHTPRCSSSTSPAPAWTRRRACSSGIAIRDLRDQGVTIVITTHDMDEAADPGRAGRDHRPRPPARARPARGARPAACRAERRSRSRWPAPTAASAGGRGARAARRRRAGRAARGERRPRAPLRDRRRAAHGRPGRDRACERGITLSDVKIGEPSLEDVFIGLTGRALR